MHFVSHGLLTGLMLAVFLAPDLCRTVLFVRHRQTRAAALFCVWHFPAHSQRNRFAPSLLATLNPTLVKPMEPKEYPYIDVLHLIGGLDELDRRFLKINGRLAMPLDRQMFLVLLVLFCHSLKRAGKMVPMDVPTGEFLSAQTILNAIEAFFETLPERPFVFKGASDQAVVKSINRIRKNLDKSGFHKFLIRPGPSKKGYALATPPENNQFNFLDPRDGSTWDASGQ